MVYDRSAEEISDQCVSLLGKQGSRRVDTVLRKVKVEDDTIGSQKSKRCDNSQLSKAPGH